MFSELAFTEEDLLQWGLSKSIKKGQFIDKNLFSDNVEWSSKNLWKMISVDVKANIKQQEIK